MESTAATIESPPAENPFANRLAAENSQVKKSSLLAQITTKKRRRPMFGLLYGPPGLGKSTFAVGLPDAVFIPTERWLDQITCNKFPTPRTFTEFYNMVLALDQEDHGYKSIIIDTCDALELLIFQRVCDEGKVKSIEDYAGGYGKGF